MAFNHRKLSTDPSTIDISICSLFCNPTENKDGYCPASCKCYPTCNRTLTSLIPPPDNNHPNKPSKIHLSLILSLSLLATICFLFSCYTIYKYYKNWQTTRSSSSRSSPNPDQDEFLDEDHGPTLDHPIWYIRTVGLQPSIINKITVCRYKRGEGLVEGTECSVCLSEFQEDETLRLLPKCNHAFHIPCIDTWLQSHTNCPMCRAGIAAASNAAVPAPLPLPPPPEQSGGDSPAPEGNFELGTGISEEDRELQVENGGISSFRRSVSLDSLSASRVFDDIARAYNTGESAGNSNYQVVSKVGIGPKKVEINRSLLRLVGGPSFGKSLQKGPVLMKRSFSCSANVFLSRYNRGRNSILPS